jgi:hypothetical protein
MNRSFAASTIALVLVSCSFVCAPATAAAAETSSSASVAPGTGDPDDSLARRRAAHDATGFTFDMRASLLVPAGDYVTGAGMSSFGPGSAISLLFGFHATRHVALVLGVRGSFGHDGFSGCDTTSYDPSCGGYSLQVPVLLEYDATDRVRGFFVQGGVGLFTSYHAFGPGTTLTVSDTLDYKAQLGWRIPIPGAAGKPSPIGLEIFGGADFGQFSSAEIQDGDSDVAGSVVAPAWHYAFEIGVGAHFTP